MRVQLGTIEVSDEVRRAIRAYHGKSGLATRQEVREFWEGHVDGILSDIVNEWRTEREEADHAQ